MATPTKSAAKPAVKAAVATKPVAAVKPAAPKVAAKAVKPVAAKPVAAKPVAAAPAKASAVKKAPSVRAQPKTLAPDQRKYYVEVAAYHIAERRGFTGGSEVNDWVEAEKEIDRLLREGILNP